MEINKKETVRVNAKTMKLHMKVCDQFQGQLVSESGKILKDYDGYVPEFFPGQHYGDYLILDIDIDTGQIVNWKKPTAADIEQFIGDNEEE